MDDSRNTSYKDDDSRNDPSDLEKGNLKNKNSVRLFGRSTASHDKPNSNSHNLLNEGIIAGQKIAKISVITLVGIGIVEITAGYISGSVVATADGIDSIADAGISFVVLLGLRIEMICLQVEMEIRSKFSDLERISVIPHTSISEQTITKTKSYKGWIPYRHRQQ